MVTITVEIDDSCKMANVSDNLGNGMGGNFWDFHNGCHGLYEFEEFNSVNEFISVLKSFHEKNGEKVNIVRKKYKYGDKNN